MGALGLLVCGLGQVAGAAPGDWLVGSGSWPARVIWSAGAHEAVLENGLLRRVIQVAPGCATVALDELSTGASLLRGVKPEAVLVIDGEEVRVGGLLGQPDYAYLTEAWRASLAEDPAALRLGLVEPGPTRAPFLWKRVRHAEDRAWPPAGVGLTLHFAAPGALPHLDGVGVRVHYELYDGMPLLAKWIEVENGTERSLRIDSVVSEVLALVEAESQVDAVADPAHPPITVFSDFAMHGMDVKSSNLAIRWVRDPQYETQVNYLRAAPVQLESRLPMGPGVTLAPGEAFTSHRTYELLHDSTERERQGLALRKAYRALAPWSTENPLLMHARNAEPAAVRLAIDQASEVGFEMVILTFWSGFDAENEDPAYRAGLKELADYAHAKGIELGGYALLSSRSIGPETDVIDLATGAPGGAVFGSAPCLGSAWGIESFAKLTRLFEQTGFDVLEHDGSYPGDACASTTHPGHRGHADSQWRQWQRITDFYRWCRGRGIYLNVPDFYFLAGSSKVAMGYRETNWSLPREQQFIHARQNMFDGTWTKAPSQGWMFVPLTEYQGGGAAATIEPLAEHLDAYETHLANNLGFGVQACWRGPRLHDGPATRALVLRYVEWFKGHRAILESDVIHLRRADGRDIDYVLHVNPELDERAMLVLWNPLDREVVKTLRVPLYYAGLTTTARVSGGDGVQTSHALDRSYAIDLPVRVPARGFAWYAIGE